MSQELTVFKIWYVILLLFNIVALAIAWAVPTHTNWAEYYAWMIVGCIILLILDIVIAKKLLKETKVAEAFDTATIEANNPKYLLQRFKVPVIACIVLALVFGGLWGLWYMQEIQLQQKPLFFVPTFYSSIPESGWAAELGVQWDAFSSAVPVAFVEETFASTIFATLLGIGMLVTDRLRLPSLQGWGVAVIIAILLTAFTFSYAQHAFTPSFQGNLPAYEGAFTHSAICSASIALTGNNLACIISHAAHNYYVKTNLRYQQFSVIG